MKATILNNLYKNIPFLNRYKKRKAAEYFALGNQSHKVLDLNQALYHYFKTIEADSAFYDVYSNIGFCVLHANWQSTKLQDEILNLGIKTLKNALKNEANTFFIHKALGDVLTANGNISEAIYHFRLASQKQIASIDNGLINFEQVKNAIGIPHFIIAGFMKCGTTALYDYLSKHPKILPATTKEIHFFTCYFDLGFDWYRAHFPNIPPNSDFITGEGTPVYINYPSLAKDIYRLLPHLKIIILLRNPVERTISSYYQTHAVGFATEQIETLMHKSLDFIDMQIRNNGFDTLPFEFSTSKNTTYKEEEYQHIHILQSVYAYYLKKWLSVFPKAQVLILKSEDLDNDTASTLKQVHHFLNVSEYELTDYPRINTMSYPAISSDLHQRLSDFFKPYNQELETLLERKFNW